MNFIMSLTPPPPLPLTIMYFTSFYFVTISRISPTSISQCVCVWGGGGGGGGGRKEINTVIVGPYTYCVCKQAFPIWSIMSLKCQTPFFFLFFFSALLNSEVKVNQNYFIYGWTSTNLNYSCMYIMCEAPQGSCI